jgi:hypothetical protein
MKVADPGNNLLEPLADLSTSAAESARKAGADVVISNGDLLSNTVRLTGAAKYKPMMGPDILIGGFAQIYVTV